MQEASQHGESPGYADSVAVRVFIAARTRVVRDALTTHLAAPPEIQLVGTCGLSHADLELLAETSPDVALVQAPPTVAPTIVREIAEHVSSTRIVAMDMDDVEADVVRVVEAGAVGYTTSDCSLEEIRTAVVRAARGEASCSARVAGALFRRLATLSRIEGTGSELTRREREVLLLVSEGLSNKEIARSLSIEVNTVKNHVHSLLTKLNVHSRSQAAAHYVSTGSHVFVDPEIYSRCGSR